MTAPHHIPERIFPIEETHMLFSAGHGTAPDLIYARGCPIYPSPDSTSLNTAQRTPILVEMGFCIDLSCNIKLEKSEKSVLRMLVKKPRVALQSILQTAEGDKDTPSLLTDISIILDEETGLINTSPREVIGKLAEMETVTLSSDPTLPP
jgi:hypothetical protein